MTGQGNLISNGRKYLVPIGLLLGAGVAAAPAAAAPFTLTYTGTLHAADSLAATAGPDLLAADTDFTFTARFDTSTPNVVGILPNPGPGRGFAAYVPSKASFTIGGVRYALTGLGTGAGPTVALFDKTNLFTGDRYGVGLIVNPLADGAGFVGDFVSASPEFSVTALRSTVFQNFAGVGFSGGIGCGPDPAPCTLQPLTLSRGGRSYDLQFASTPGAAEGGVSYNGGAATAVLSAVPEPAAWATMLLGFGLTGLSLRRRGGPAMVLA